MKFVDLVNPTRSALCSISLRLDATDCSASGS